MAQNKRSSNTPQNRQPSQRAQKAGSARSAGAPSRTHAASASKRTAAARSGGSSAPARAAAAPAAMPREPRGALLDMQAHHDIAGVIIGVIGVALLIAVLMPTTGMLTTAVSTGLHNLLGVGAVIAPVALILWAVTFFVHTDRIMPGRCAVGLGLIALAVISLLGICTPGAEETPSVLFNAYVLPERGGYLGNGIAWLLLSLTGRVVGIVVLAGVIVAGLIVIGFSVTQTIQDLAIRHRERREWARLQSQERAAQRAREQQEAWYARAGAQVPADYAPTALFDPDRPLSASGSAATSVIRPMSRPASSRARSFGCGNAPMGGDEYDQLDDEQPQAPVTRRMSSTQRATSRAADETTFLQPVDLQNEAYEEEPYLDEAPATAGAHGMDAPLRDPAPARRPRSRRAASVERNWWDGQPQDDDYLTSAFEALAEDDDIPVPGVIEGAPQTLEDFGVTEQEPPAEGGARKPSVTPAPAAAAAATARPPSKRQASAAPAKPAAKAQAEELPWDEPAAPAAGAGEVSTGDVSVSPSGQTGGSGTYEDFVLPDPSILKRNTHGIQKTKQELAEIEATARDLQQTLNEFGVKAEVVDWICGPTCTTYEVSPGEGVRVSRFTSLEDDIARALATQSVRIYAPVPGTRYVGIEVPNTTRQTVYFGDVLPYVDGGPLDFAVGLDANGKPVHIDLAKLPHLLVCGTTGSGKSVMVNSIVMSMLMRATPDEVRLIMVDPKQVEFKDYDGIPHLVMPVITDMRQAAAALQWGVTEMDRRYRVFSNVGVRDLKRYNQMVEQGAFQGMETPLQHLPSIVIVVDELADLMMVAKKDVEASIVRIAQLGRAAGVHLILATQTPRADVVTGLIRANVACRAGLKVAKGTDSQIAIDQTGAEKLLGNGDMLFLQTAWGDKPRRIQGCYLSDDEISQTVEHLKAQAVPEGYDIGMAPLGTSSGQLTLSLDGGSAHGAASGAAGGNEDEPMAQRAARIVVENQLGSTSMIQRQLKLGYARAGRIMDMLEEMGVVGPARGSKPREVLVHDLESLETLLGTQSFEEDY